MTKVPVGVTSATGYGVTLATVVAAALDYIGGDHSQPTKTTLYLGIAAGLSFLSTQLGRYAQAHALAKKTATIQVPWPSSGVQSGTTGGVLSTGLQGVAEDWPGEDAPAESALYPLTDPSSIPPDEGDAEAGSA